MFKNYIIKTNGEIYSKARQGTPERKLKYDVNKNTNACTVVLYEDDFRKRYYVHRLVAMTFLSNYSEKLEVNHIDGNRLNNDLSNLEMVNRSENIKHAYKNNLIKKKFRKVSNNIKVFNSLTDASIETNTNINSICQCCRGKRKLANKMSWCYV